MEHLRTHAQPLRERIGAHRNHHELLEVHRVRGMRAAVEDVHHRHGERAGHGAAEIAIERQTHFERRGARDGHGHAQHRVGAEPALVLRAVEVEQRAVDRDLIGGVHAFERFGHFGVDVVHRQLHTLAAVALRIAVTQFHRFALAGAGTARHRRTAGRAGLEDDIDFDGGVTARVEDFAGGDGNDGSHLCGRFVLGEVGERQRQTADRRRWDPRVSAPCLLLPASFRTVIYDDAGADRGSARGPRPSPAIMDGVTP